MTENNIPLPELEGSSANTKKKKERKERPSLSLRSPGTQKLLIIVITIVLMTAMFIVSIIPKRYDMEIGSVAYATVRAYKNCIDTEKTNQLLRAAEEDANQHKVYNSVDNAASRSKRNIDNVFIRLNAVRQYACSLDPLLNGDSAQGENDQPVITHSTISDYTADELQHARELLSSKTSDEAGQDTLPPIDLSDDELIRVMNSDETELEILHAQLLAGIPEDDLYEVKSENLESFITGIVYPEGMALIEGQTSPDSDGLLLSIGLKIMSACVEPRYYVDEKATEDKKQAARDSVEPVIIYQGDPIVREGETVSAEKHQIMEDMGLLVNGPHVDPGIYIGGGLLVITIMLIAVFLLFVIKPDPNIETSRVLISGIMLVGDFALCILAKRFSIYIAPILLGAMILSSMVSLRSGMIMNIVLSILVSSLTAGGSDSFSQQMIIITIANILGGTVACMIVRNATSRLRALICIPSVAAIHAVVCLAINMMTSSDVYASMTDIGYLSIGTAVSVLLFIALQPIFESVFNLPTQTKLIELSNPNHPLLKRLVLEAPGTYHHSLMVANLAEASAEAIGANPLLARVGGYFHDVGKLMRPLFFKENQVGEENAHDHTDPQVSAAILTAHPGDGVSIAKAYRLPKAIQQIIATHHGNSPVMYFYSKALQQAEGKDVNIDNFRYNAALPSTRESAIIMICDTIEAAVRSMKNPSPEEIEEFIHKLIRGKIEDGQLSQSPLTLQDIDKIINTCVKQMTGVFHERISYPDPPQKETSRHSRSKATPPVEPPKNVPMTKPEYKTPAAPAAAVSAKPPVAAVPAAPKTVSPAAVAVQAPAPVVAPVVLKPVETSEENIAIQQTLPIKELTPSEVKVVMPEKEAPIPVIDPPMPVFQPVLLDELLKSSKPASNDTPASVPAEPQVSSDPADPSESGDRPSC
ncbi:MAG: hypothetical protein CW338_03725 [Clostridiales bacterium]|nr:hypothetical protein [Clostridiales bacterium]